MQTDNFYDVIIVGAGIAGLTLASKLAGADLKIAIMDKQLITENLAQQDDLRVSAITPASKKILAALELWQTNISAFNKMYVWTPDGSHVNFTSAEVGEPALGYIVENKRLQSALYQSLKDSANITFIAPAQLQTIKINVDKIMLYTVDAVFKAALLVGADGANSVVRTLANIDSQEQDYQHTSIIATITTELPHQQTAWQCFLPSGPLAFLPLADSHKVSIVWSTMPQQAAQLLQKDDETFCLELAKAFDYRLGRIKTTSRRISFSLRRRHAKQYVQANLALIGDAAHTIHPLAGQGLNLGILDADCLAKVILAAHEQQRHIGSFATLRKYERARKADNVLMFALVDNLKQLFATTISPIKLIRNIGLNKINNSGLIKKYLIKQAIGARN